MLPLAMVLPYFSNVCLLLAMLGAEPEGLDEEPKNSVSLCRNKLRDWLSGTVDLPGSPNTRPHSRVMLAAGVAA